MMPSLATGAAVNFEALGSRSNEPSTDQYYSTRIRQLMRLDLPEDAARALWMEVGAHRADLVRRLGRDVGQRVALLDYVVNVTRHHVNEPQIIERDTLAALEKRAMGDPLTELFNRGFFEIALAREVERFKRSGRPTALMMLDLDRFKEVNDREGHRRGDEVLRSVARIVREQVRGADLPCRYGGDELAAILPEADESEAERVAERIRASVEQLFRAAPVAVTASLGVAQCAVDGFAADDLVRRADWALYRAKGAGGNRVVPFRDGPPLAAVR
jgi:diguanylate cyclase (GGDEF)-like protein